MADLDEVAENLEVDGWESVDVESGGWEELAFETRDIRLLGR